VTYSAASGRQIVRRYRHREHARQAVRLELARDGGCGWKVERFERPAKGVAPGVVGATENDAPSSGTRAPLRPGLPASRVVYEQTGARVVALGGSGHLVVELRREDAMGAPAWIALGEEDAATKVRILGEALRVVIGRSQLRAVGS
jgi:hypothetical protein